MRTGLADARGTDVPADGATAVPGPVAGSVTGLVALAAGLGAAELAAGVVRDAPTPVVSVGQAVIDLVPAPVKDWAIDTFGTADKAVLIAGTVSVLAVVGVVAGVLAVRGRRDTACVIALAIGAIGSFATITRPGATVGDLAPTAIGTACTVAVLWFLPATLRRAGDDPGGAPDAVPGDGHRPAASPMGVDRRAFVGGAAAIAVGATATGGLGRLLQRRFAIGEERRALDLPAVTDRAALPAGADLGLDGVSPFVTPNDAFYRIDTALTVPQVSAESWRLRVHGLVDRELELTFDELLARPQVERYVTLSCVSNEVGGNLVGNARWQGVLLADVLREAGVRAGAEQLASRSADGWTCGTPVREVMDGRDALLAVGMNGEPLPARHGYPVRMVVPGLYGYVSATKWVTDIELTTWDAFDAYWVPRGWAREAPVKTMARIDRPRRGSSWDAARLDIGGVAWAVHRGVSAVEIRIDEGPWTPCDLGGAPSDDTWRQWRYVWQSPEPGEHVVEARAVDGRGEVQPSEPRRPAPDGAQGYHRVRFTVRDR